MKILQLRGYILFLSLGMVLFFLGAFTVILVRTKSPYQTSMPNLVGKNYTSVHNELLRLRLKVILEHSRLPEKNEGEILSQSVAPGKQVEAGSHVYLTVNQGYDRIEMPNLKGQNISRGKEMLEKVLSGDLFVSMPIGGITYIEAKDGESAEIIVDQIPEPGKITTSGEKVYLLVTESPKKETKNQSFILQPFPFVAESLNRKKIPWKITQWEPIKQREKTGLVTVGKLQSTGYEFIVGKPPEGNRIEEGYEFISWEVPKSGVYQVETIAGEEKNISKEIAMLPLPWKEGETISLAFYRQGQLQANILTVDQNIEKKYKWKSEL